MDDSETNGQLLCHVPFDPILGIAIGVFLLELGLSMLQPRAVFARGEERALKQKVASLHREAEQFANPSTYVKWAKLSRIASQEEKKLLEMQNERDARELGQLNSTAKKINKFKWPIIFAAIWIGTTRGEGDVLLVPEEWMYPFARVVRSMWSFPLFQQNTISLWFWGVMVSRVTVWLLRVPSMLLND